MLATGSNVSVYVLRERLQETLEKRESLKKDEEIVLKEAIEGLPFAEKLLTKNESLYNQAFNAVLKDTEGYENLENWRAKYLKKQ